MHSAQSRRTAGRELVVDQPHPVALLPAGQDGGVDGLEVFDGRGATLHLDILDGLVAFTLFLAAGERAEGGSEGHDDRDSPHRGGA